MTEYKKLVALSELLRDDVTKLCALVAGSPQDAASAEEDSGCAALSSTCGETEELFAVSSRIQAALPDGCLRMRKMVQKARETDPNRQIYNEAMCGKIEKVFEFFCESLEMLAPSFFDNPNASEETTKADEQRSADRFSAILDVNFDAGEVVEHSPVLQTVEAWHNRYILNRAKEEAWHSRVAEGLSDAVAFEAQTRSLVVAEEKFARSSLMESKRADKMRIISLLESRAAAKWKAELQRREAELCLFRDRGGQIDDIACASEFVKGVVPNEKMRRDLAKRTGELIAALLRTPEDLNIRRLRNNNEHFVCDYGHPCLVAITGDDGTPCACAAILHAAEALWCRIGYVIRYTKTPNRSIESLRLEQRAEKLILPCGFPLSAHAYRPLGFEDYSERFFELMEPNAMANPDEWMQWYGMMQEIQSALTRMMHE